MGKGEIAEAIGVKIAHGAFGRTLKRLLEAGRLVQPHGPHGVYGVA
jgi:hypothetical protein